MNQSMRFGIYLSEAFMVGGGVKNSVREIRPEDIAFYKPAHNVLLFRAEHHAAGIPSEAFSRAAVHATPVYVVGAVVAKRHYNGGPEAARILMEEPDNIHIGIHPSGQAHIVRFTEVQPHAGEAFIDLRKALYGEPYALESGLAMPVAIPA